MPRIPRLRERPKTKDWISPQPEHRTLWARAFKTWSQPAEEESGTEVALRGPQTIRLVGGHNLALQPNCAIERERNLAKQPHGVKSDADLSVKIMGQRTLK